MRVRIDLAYDGAPFAGFARQPDQETVQGTLEGALSRVLGQQVDTTCAGRTDRGVHAIAQVVHLDVEVGRRPARALADLEVLARRIDRMVGDAIVVRHVAAVPAGAVEEGGFDARFSATWRSYRYRLSPGPADPRSRGSVWTVGADLDVPAMDDAVRVVVGEHDFASFCRAAPGRTTRRRLDRAEVVAVAPVGGIADEVHVTLRGSAFCHQQVRSVVGSLVEIGRGRRDARWLAAALAARDRAAAGPVAPPHGLTLEAVGYPEPFPDAPHPPAPRRPGPPAPVPRSP